MTSPRHLIILAALTALVASARVANAQTEAPDQTSGDASADTAGETAGDAGSVDQTAAKPEDADTALARVLTPYAVIVGGVRIERLMLRKGETTQSRSPTLAVSRLGVRGHIGDHLDFASEFEADLGGSLGYGASVWEGQSQMSVRDQFVRYHKDGFAIAVGRISDDATIDYYSEHVADVLLLDFYTRWPIIFSGGDRGTGANATYDFGGHYRAGLTIHSTNPTGLTGSYQIGGALFPFTRPFGLAAAQVGRSDQNQPDTNLHMYFGTASMVGEFSRVQFKTAVQAYQLDTQMLTTDDQPIYGYNLRANVRVKLHAKVAAWLNGSRNENEMLDPMDAKVKLPDTYSVYTFGGGVDYDYSGHNGVGIQYEQTRQTEGVQNPVTEHYFNIGTTYWIYPMFSTSLRYGWYLFDDHQRDVTGHASVFLTGRLIL